MNQREEAAKGSTVKKNTGRSVVLALTLLFVLAAVFVSTGLVVYTAWHHDLENSPFALAFAALSARAVLSWVLWRSSDHPVSSSAGEQDLESRKPADEPTR